MSFTRFIPIWMSDAEAQHCLDVLSELAADHNIEWPERVHSLFEYAIGREQRRTLAEMNEERAVRPPCTCLDPTAPGWGASDDEDPCPVHPEGADRGTKRIRLDLSDGAHMNATVAKDIDEASLDALRRVGEVALEKMRDDPDWPHPEGGTENG